MFLLRFSNFHFLQFIFIFFSVVFAISNISPAYCQYSWKAQHADTEKDLHGVTYGGGLFVAVGENGTILTSADALNWKSQKSGITNTLYKVIYGKNQFIAVGENAIVTSVNGTEWSVVRPDNAFKHLRGISYGNNKYVAVAGFSGVLTSADGVNWVPQSSSNTNYFTGINYCGNSFIATGGGGIQALSPAYTGWMKTNYSLPAGKRSQQLVDFTDVAYGKGLFVAVGTKAVLTSTDGIKWTEFINDELPYCYSVNYGGGQFVAVGFNGAIKTSPDGVNWVNQSSNSERILYGICSSKDKFVTVGERGTILSADIKNITRQPVNQAKSDSVNNPVLIAENLDQISIYPNPSESGHFKVVLPENTLRLRVVSPQGTTVYSLSTPSSASDIDLSHLSGGMYLLHVDTPIGSRVVKLIKL